MGVPRSSLLTDTDLELLYEQFIKSVSLDEIHDHADRIIRHRGNMHIYADRPGGVMGAAIRNLILEATRDSFVNGERYPELLGKIVNRLIEHYNICAGDVPPRALLRESLRLLRVLHDSIDSLLHCGYGQDYQQVLSVLEPAVGELSNPGAAFTIDDTVADMILAKLWDARK